MMLMRQQVEILLDSPHQRDYVVSAYADMTVQDGFSRYVDRYLKNQARAAGEALAAAEARKDLDANLAVIREVVQARHDPAARGLAVFSSVARGLRHVIPLEFPVENHLVIDEEPFLLPILEHWYGDPSYLIVLFNSNEAHLFEAHPSRPEPLRDLQRADADQEFQRDKPQFTYKKRFAATPHERLHDAKDAPFLREVADALAEQWKDGRYAGLILLGQSQDIGALRKLIRKELDARVVGEAPHAMTTRPDALTGDVSRLVNDWRAERERQILAELNERWKRDHLVANGATEVLDALQQGRAVQVLIGTRRDIPGAHCMDCGYRFGAPVGVCPYCEGRCRRVNAVQDILRLAMRHQIPVELLRLPARSDPLEPAGGVVAMVRASANWANAPKGAAAVAQESPDRQPGIAGV
jgi:protein required for attachment to host cells